MGAFLLLLVFMVGAAGWYTSRSEFCNTCHIMEPYYKSWQESSHKDVPCIECHFAPGAGGKLRGKMLGLVQLAKYVTRSEGPRPAAEVPDASCLRSGCHETRLLSGRVEYQGVHFDHAPHMGETRRGMQLRCTSCHGQIVQGQHMAVTMTTCFLCHFKNEPFNEGLAACTHCHQIPEKQYDLGGGVKFTHELAYKKGVDCINCHTDVIRGKGDVPRERCLVCHNREGDLARISDYAFMHAKHVAEHAVDCLDCHLRIEHSFDKAAAAARRRRLRRLPPQPSSRADQDVRGDRREDDSRARRRHDGDPRELSYLPSLQGNRPHRRSALEGLRPGLLDVSRSVGGGTPAVVSRGLAGGHTGHRIGGPRRPQGPRVGRAPRKAPRRRSPSSSTASSPTWSSSATATTSTTSITPPS